MRSAKLRRVTSTSGNSGMVHGFSCLDYYGPMSRINRLLSLTLLAACMGTSGWAAAPKAEGPNNSKLDGELFYQLLMG